MKSGEIKIDEHGKILVAGELFELRHTDPVTIPFKGYLDTGCTYDFVVPMSMANGVFASIESSTTVSVAAGAGTAGGTMRKVNIRLGGLEARNILAFVPDIPSDRVLLGVGFLQKMNAFLGLDFHSGATQGCILTNDRGVPFLIGKVLHCRQVHQKEIVPRGPCEFCGQAGNPE